MTTATRIRPKAKSFSTSFLVSQSPTEVFNAVTNVRGWWSYDIKGKTEKAGDVFSFRYQDIHRTTQRIVEAVPGERVVWQIDAAYLSFTEDKEEWKGTKVVFDITPKGKKTELSFTHDGLVPKFECFTACSEGWTFFIATSLKKLITTGKGEPVAKD
ncbi:MAG TPA: SRPBCC domain-containing protein [Usitatibacter sp.]|jgi:uncharacterized protein YndB with AHSA1/START domain